MLTAGAQPPSAVDALQPPDLLPGHPAVIVTRGILPASVPPEVTHFWSDEQSTLIVRADLPPAGVAAALADVMCRIPRLD